MPPERMQDRIRRLASLRGWKLKDLVKESKVPYRTLQDIWRGKTDNPEPETVRKLAVALEVTEDVLLHGGGATQGGAASEADDRLALVKEALTAPLPEVRRRLSGATPGAGGASGHVDDVTDLAGGSDADDEEEGQKPA